MAKDTTEVWFYHLERATLERVLPDLLEKTLKKGWRAVVRAGSDERIDYINTHLWTYNPNRFLPHGAEKDGHSTDQPIYLTTDDENPNEAEALFLVDGAEADNPSRYTRCIKIFDGRDDEAVEAARAYWTKVKDIGCDVTYWQQNQKGAWEQKA